MPAVTTLTFTKPLNVSCQVGDTVYVVQVSSSGGYNINSNTVSVVGVITSITGSLDAPVINISNGFISSFNESDFFLFSKDNKANLSSLLGYYAEVKFVNNSSDAVELFSVGVDVFESSK